MAPDGHRTTSRAAEPPSGRDALLVFLATTSVLMTFLALALGLRPQWFGSDAGSARGSEPGPAVEAPTGSVKQLAPRLNAVDQRAADLDGLDGARSATARAAAPPTLHQLLFADTMPSVVHVTTLATGRGDLPTPIVPVETDLDRYVSGTGSGLVWDTAGHIVTCKHVLDNVDGATVTLWDGTRWSAKFVGVDDTLDLAIVRIAAPKEQLVPIRLGSSVDLTVGMTALSIASPFGLGHSLSVGYVSGLGRRIRSTTGRVLENTIQTDAAIHRGSSGGALIDDQGRVVGLNAAIHSESERAVGVGFALPIDDVTGRVPAIIESGYRWYPSFGLTVTGDAMSRERLAGLPRELQGPESGIVVAQVDDGSVAAAAGLRGLRSYEPSEGGAGIVVRDIIVGIDGAKAVSRAGLDRAIIALQSGETLRLRLARRTGEVDVQLQKP